MRRLLKLCGDVGWGDNDEIEEVDCIYLELMLLCVYNCYFGFCCNVSFLYLL